MITCDCGKQNVPEIQSPGFDPQSEEKLSGTCYDSYPADSDPKCVSNSCPSIVSWLSCFSSSRHWFWEHFLSQSSLHRQLIIQNCRELCCLPYGSVLLFGSCSSYWDGYLSRPSDFDSFTFTSSAWSSDWDSLSSVFRLDSNGYCLVLHCFIWSFYFSASVSSDKSRHRRWCDPLLWSTSWCFDRYFDVQLNVTLFHSYFMAVCLLSRCLLMFSILVFVLT